MSKDGIVVLTL